MSSPARRRRPVRTSCAVSTDTLHNARPDRNGLGNRWEALSWRLSIGERAEENDREAAYDDGSASVRRKATPSPRKSTPKQITRWKAVHEARRKGLSVRGITRETGIHRNTVKKYLEAESPPMALARVTPKTS